jgi:hypothetical protein
VADRFVVPQSGADDGEGALFAADGTGSAAGGARLLVAQRCGLSFEEDFRGAFTLAVGGGLGALLQGVEVEFEGIEVGAGAAGDDLAPLRGEEPEFLELGGGELGSRHDESCPGVKTTMRWRVSSFKITDHAWRGKAVHDLHKNVRPHSTCLAAPGPGTITRVRKRQAEVLMTPPPAWTRQPG